MDGNEWLADGFEEHRAHLRAVAYRMLGSLTEADDAVQDTSVTSVRLARRPRSTHRSGTPAHAACRRLTHDTLHFTRDLLS